jgi:RimJ/RimL family protein N-acetyltransferase
MKSEFTFFDPGDLVEGDLQLILIRKYPGDPARDHVPEYIFEMRCLGNPDKIGEIALKIGDLPAYIGHLRYSVLPAYRGHRYAARSCMLLVSLARRHGMTEIVITCLPDNTASKRTCELAGATFAGMVDVPSEGTDDYHKGIKKNKCKYILRTTVMDQQIQPIAGKPGSG